MCLYALIEYRFVRNYTNSFISAKAIAVYLIPLLTALIFYAYTAIVGEEILIVDIVIFFVAITIGQLVSYKIIVSADFPRYIEYISFAFILLLAAILTITTFYPPHWPIFMDGTGFYGLP